MERFFVCILLLPQIIFGDKGSISSNTDSEKYSHDLTPSQSLYCNDLNPQSHLDFNMVMKSLSLDSRWAVMTLLSPRIAINHLWSNEGSL